MHQVLRKPKSYWNNENLVTCFMDSLRNLLDGLKRKSITDVFFTNVRIMSDKNNKPKFLFVGESVG